MKARRSSRRRRGVTRGDVIVLILLIAGTGVLVLMGLSRARETARLAGCTRNLGQIGFALALYDQMHGSLPQVGTPAAPDLQSEDRPPGPLRMMLEELDIPDFTDLRDPKTRPESRSGGAPVERVVPGFFCTSDPNALSGRLPAPVSYRAATGATQAGTDGAFAPGRRWSLADVEARDGLSYTAAFSERLVGGDPRNAMPLYHVVPPPLPKDRCEAATAANRWRDDAGSSWFAAEYRSTLYNHALTPNGFPSCIASDGRTAFMGASSGHVRGVNVLRLDGSVALTAPTIAPGVWRSLAAIRQPAESGSP